MLTERYNTFLQTFLNVTLNITDGFVISRVNNMRHKMVYQGLGSALVDDIITVSVRRAFALN